MTQGERRSRSDASGWGRRGLGDLSFLILSVALIALPAWLRLIPPGGVRVLEGSAEPAKIDVNRAPWFEFALLEGIGEARARRVVEYRDAHGPFRCIEDLEKIPRMPAGWAERALGHLSFGE